MVKASYMKVLDGGRISIAALALGIAKVLIKHCMQYSKESVNNLANPFPIFQGVAFKLADMLVKLRLLNYSLPGW